MADATIRLNRSEIAALFRVDVKTIDRWRSEGMPIIEASAQGKPAVYDVGDVIQWRRQRDKSADDPNTYADARRRREVAVASLREIEAAERARTMVNVRDVVAAVEQILGVVKSRLTTVPTRCAVPAANQPMEVVERIVRGEIHAALAELSTFDVSALNA